MNHLNDIARRLLESGTVKRIIGYRETEVPNRVQPVILTRSEEAQLLVFNVHCLQNLAAFLTRREFKKDGVTAITAKGCDIRAIVQLIAENQISRDHVYIIAMQCGGVVQPDKGNHSPMISPPKCGDCKVKTPQVYDELCPLDQSNSPVAQSSRPLSERLEELKRWSPEERWKYWTAQFEKCIRCYACRQVCPLCYCENCVVGKSQPRWIESSASKRANLSWNLIRAFHLGGRCIGCQECERACPADIPLSLLNYYMADIAMSEFSYEPGIDPNAPTLLGTYAADDCEDFIR